MREEDVCVVRVKAAFESRSTLPSKARQFPKHRVKQKSSAYTGTKPKFYSIIPQHSSAALSRKCSHFLRKDSTYF